MRDFYPTYEHISDEMIVDCQYNSVADCFSEGCLFAIKHLRIRVLSLLTLKKLNLMYHEGYTEVDFCDLFNDEEKALFFFGKYELDTVLERLEAIEDYIDYRTEPCATKLIVVEDSLEYHPSKNIKVEPIIFEGDYLGVDGFKKECKNSFLKGYVKTCSVEYQRIWDQHKILFVS